MTACRNIPVIRRALTLIETLAVVVLIGMVTAAVGVGLGRTGDDAAMRTFAARWNELDTRARLLAPTIGDGVLRLEVDAERGTVIVRHGVGAILTVDIPPGMNVSLLLGGAERWFVVFDRAGRSQDYDLWLSTAERSAAWRFHGLTGAVQHMEDEL